MNENYICYNIVKIAKLLRNMLQLQEKIASLHLANNSKKYLEIMNNYDRIKEELLRGPEIVNN